MFSNTKRNSLIILGITAVLLARTMLLSFNDPEGPNLLVVTVMALVVYAPSLVVYRFGSPNIGQGKFLFALLSQLLLVTVLYLVLK